MSAAAIEVRAGGTPTPAQMAALACAATAFIESQGAAAAADPVPAVYRSAWRRAAIAEGLRRGGRAA